MKRFLAVIMLVLISLTFAGCSFNVVYDNFIAVAQEEFTTPGLDADFVPQAITYVGKEDKYIIAGYMTDKTASRLYVVDSLTGKSLKYVTVSIDGKPYKEHAGGIAYSGDTLWLSSGGKGHKLTLQSVLDAQGKGDVSIVGSFDSGNSASYCYAEGGQLWIGEFYEKRDYKTDASHHTTSPNGDKSYSVLLGFTIDESAPSGVASATPTKAIATRDKAQGICKAANGNWVVSTSYGRKNASYIYIYNDVTNKKAQAEITLDGSTIPLWYLDSTQQLSELKAPPMTEGVILKGNRVLVLFESGAKYYRDTAKFAQDKVWSI